MVAELSAPVAGSMGQQCQSRAISTTSLAFICPPIALDGEQGSEFQPVAWFTPVVLPKDRRFQHSKRVPRGRCR
jgi:hypothetical protein